MLDVRDVSVAFDDPAAKVKKFFAQRGGDWPVLVDGTEESTLDYAVVKLPESYLVNPDGKVVQNPQCHSAIDGLSLSGFKLRI